MGEFMKIEMEQIRSHRLRAHHLDQKLPLSGLLQAAGACGLQNSPPGAWETALFQRLEGCTLQALHSSLYREKSLLQAWSFRGAPVVFPTKLKDVFLTALLAREGEQPWIYTMGIAGALDFLKLPFEDLLCRTGEAAKYLDSHIVKSKEALDRTLAEIIERDLPEDKKELWRAPSIYGSPDKQTMGGAAVSFLLRPCSFQSLVVFGERQGISPTFTSFKNWTGCVPEQGEGQEAETRREDAEKELVRRFLHCYGPAVPDSFMAWLGSSGQQARRLWNSIREELEPVLVGKKTCYMLSEDMESLLHPVESVERLMLLGAHDPYLDIRDRAVILENPTLQKAVWKIVANPGVILKGGRAAGTWKTKTGKEKLDISMTLFEPLNAQELKNLKQLAEEYAAFRLLDLKSCEITE